MLKYAAIAAMCELHKKDNVIFTMFYGILCIIYVILCMRIIKTCQKLSISDNKAGGSLLLFVHSYCSPGV